MLLCVTISEIHQTIMRSRVYQQFNRFRNHVTCMHQEMMIRKKQTCRSRQTPQVLEMEQILPSACPYRICNWGVTYQSLFGLHFPTHGHDSAAVETALEDLIIEHSAACA